MRRWIAASLLLTLAACGGGSPAAPIDAPPPADARVPDATSGPPPYLCVFDYDLTLSSHLCPATDNVPAYHCRTTVCDTYGWHDQCLGIGARAAIAECVARGAMIGIASHADADLCWTDKVTPIVSEMQFPEWTSSPRYAAPASAGFAWIYPQLDDRTHWNCDDCAYTMDGSVAKPVSVSRVMRHFGLDPASPADRARVLFWDDTPSNIDMVHATLPEVTAVLVPRNGTTGQEGGCGITQAEIDSAWMQATGAP